MDLACWRRRLIPVPGILKPWFQANGFTRELGVDRFWRKVLKPADPAKCWEWQNGRCAAGYGVFRWHGKLVYAHRLAYELYHATTVPAHLVVRHRCDNPLCCRPSHLEVGTRHDNSRDMVARGRRRSGVLSQLAVLDIRRLHAAHTPITEICARHQVTQRTVWLIVSGRTYRHLHEAA